MLIVKSVISTWKSAGFSVVLKTYGWKIVIFVFFFYLIRDAILYLLIPYLVVNGFISK